MRNGSHLKATRHYGTVLWMISILDRSWFISDQSVHLYPDWFRESIMDVPMQQFSMAANGREGGDSWGFWLWILALLCFPAGFFTTLIPTAPLKGVRPITKIVIHCHDLTHSVVTHQPVCWIDAKLVCLDSLSRSTFIVFHSGTKIKVCISTGKIYYHKIYPKSVEKCNIKYPKGP